MDKYAARQLEKKKAAEEKARIALDAATKPLNERLNRKQKDALNAVFGFPDPPKQVFAVGKDRCAAVWWPYEVPEWNPEPEPEIVEPVDEAFVMSPRPLVNPHTILSWQVHRYRKDRSEPNGDWHYKGFTLFTNLTKTQVQIEDLANDYEYRFEIKGTNIKGTGSESKPSNPVMVEAPLPSGWFRFYDAECCRHYYANVKLNKSRWDRPEKDPFFLDESILFNFQDNEIQALYRLYSEDMAHFNCVSINQFLDILREVGEKCSKSWIQKLFRGYAKHDEEIRSWTHFMEIINHIKRRRMTNSIALANPLESALVCFSKSKVKNMMKPKNFKMGDWRIEYSEIASRYYYRNIVTGESHWSMPPQVKFYIPPKLEEKLLRVFDYGQIEEFQQYFSLLDIDNSGDLSEKEIKLLLNALQINLTDAKFQRLYKTADLNGNGTIEFDEYCWMMYEINRKDKSAFYKDDPKLRRPAVRKKDPLGVDEEYNAADNSYHSQEINLYNDKMFSGKLNFNTIKYTVLNFRNSNNSSSGSKLVSAFKSMRGLARSISIKGGHGNIDTSGHNGRRFSLNSVDSFNSLHEQAPPGLLKQMSRMFINTNTTTNNNATTRNTRLNSQELARQSSKLNAMLSKFDDSKVVDASVAAIKKRKSLTFASPSYNAAIASAREAAQAAAVANDKYNKDWEEEMNRQRQEEEWEHQQEGKSTRSFGFFGYMGSSKKKPASPKRVEHDEYVEDHYVEDDRHEEEENNNGPVHYSAFMNRYKPSKVYSLPFEWEKRTAVVEKSAPKPMVLMRPPDYPPPDADADLLRKYVKTRRQKSQLVVESSHRDIYSEMEERTSSKSRTHSPTSQKRLSMKGSSPTAKSSGDSPTNRSRASSVPMMMMNGSPGQPSGKFMRQNSSSNNLTRTSSFKRSNSRRSVESGDDNSSSVNNDDSKGGSRRSSRSKGSFLRSLSSKILPFFGDGNESDSSVDNSSGSTKKKPHPKHCMCGCRAF